MVRPDRPRMAGWRMRLNAGYLKLQTHTQSMYYLLIFYCSNSCLNAPHCYVTRTLPVLVVSAIWLMSL